MGKAKRARQRAHRVAKQEAARQLPPLTDAMLEELLVENTVRGDCEHASTRTTPDGLILIRCARDVAVGGGCPPDCDLFETRRVGGVR